MIDISRFKNYALVSIFPFILSSFALAQSLDQPEGFDALVVGEAAVVPGYDFAILGVTPGMPIEEALALIEEHLGEELSPLDGTLRVTNPDGKAFQMRLRVGYETPGVDYYLRNQSSAPYDSVEIDVSTPAIGSVVTAIRREVRVSMEDGPDRAALSAQLEGLYGKLSELPNNSDRIWRWVLDRDYTPIPMPEPYDPYSYKACDLGLPYEAHFSYQLAPALGDERRCGASYTAEYTLKNTGTITMNFQLIDYNLMVQDHAAAKRQIDERLSIETQPADMKL